MYHMDTFFNKQLAPFFGTTIPRPAFWSSLHLFFRFPWFFESPIPPQSLYRCNWERRPRLVALAILGVSRIAILPWSSQAACGSGLSFLPFILSVLCSCASLSGLRHMYKCDTCELMKLVACARRGLVRIQNQCDGTTDTFSWYGGQSITSNNAGARWSHWMPALPLFAARLFHRPALRLTRVSADLGLRRSRIY
jgi:hypothetical protein